MQILQYNTVHLHVLKEPAKWLISSLCSGPLCLTSQIRFPANVNASAVAQKAFVHKSIYDVSQS